MENVLTSVEIQVNTNVPFEPGVVRDQRNVEDLIKPLNNNIERSKGHSMIIRSPLISLINGGTTITMLSESAVVG